MSKCIEYFQHYYNSNKKLWFKNYNFNRANIVIINQIKANYYNLAASLTRVNFINDSKQTKNETCLPLEGRYDAIWRHDLLLVKSVSLMVFEVADYEYQVKII